MSKWRVESFSDSAGTHYRVVRDTTTHWGRSTSETGRTTYVLQVAQTFEYPWDADALCDELNAEVTPDEP